MTTVSNKTDKPINSIHSLEYFCDLTCRAFPDKVFQTQRILSHCDGWGILADEWERLCSGTYLFVMRDILHTLVWGFPYQKAVNDEYFMLVKMASEELMNDTPAHRIWTQKRYFKVAKIDVAHDPYCGSPDHYYFVECVMTLKLWRYLPGHEKECKKADCYIEQYKNRICKLIPTAQKWYSDYWLDERHILKEILRVHNVDYSHNFISYLCLNVLLVQAEKKSNDVDYEALIYLCNIDICSMSLVKIVWDASELALLLLYAEKIADNLNDKKDPYGLPLPFDGMGDITYTSLCQCWLFKYVRQQLNEGSIAPQYITDTKRAIFNISMRANGC